MSGRGRGDSRGGRKMTYKEKSGISYVKQDEPDFIKKLKAQMGYKEPAKLEDKFDADAVEDDDHDEEFGADGPQIVVLNPSKDLSREELDKELAAKKKGEDEKLIAEGKIQFKKPVKRTAEQEEAGTSDEKKRKEEKKRDSSPLPKANKALLSFGDDEDDEE